MPKIFVNDYSPINTHALADSVARLLMQTELQPVTKLTTIKSIDDRSESRFLLVNVDSYIHSNMIVSFRLILERLNKLNFIIISDHPRSFLINVLPLKETDEVIDAQSTWMEFAKAIRSIVEPSDNLNPVVTEQLIKLTKRQRQILILCQQGKNNREVAEVLNVSEHTVKVHAWRLYRRLGVKNRLEAIAKAKRMGAI